MRTAHVLVVTFFVLVVLNACTPAPTPTPLPPTPDARATETQIAANVIATQTASAPTPTSTFTATPPPTVTSTPTMTPLPTATEIPLPTATSTAVPDTSVVLTDDFSGHCFYTSTNNADGILTCENGEYTILSKAQDTSWWSYYSDSLDNVVIEADARMVSGTDPLNYGIAFRVSSDGNIFYVFRVAPTSGKYTVMYHTKGSWTELIPLTPSTAIKMGQEVNHLKVIAQGQDLAFFVNGQFVNRIADSTLASGKVGFLMYSGEPNGKAAFDNLSVSKINRLLTLPTVVAVPPTAAPTGKPPTRVPSALPSCADTPPGSAGLLFINHFDGEATVTIVDHEYHIPANTRLLIPVPAGKKFTIDAYIPGKGRLRPALGPFTWADGECHTLEPN